MHRLVREKVSVLGEIKLNFVFPLKKKWKSLVTNDVRIDRNQFVCFWSWMATFHIPNSTSSLFQIWPSLNGSWSFSVLCLFFSCCSQKEFLPLACLPRLTNQDWQISITIARLSPPTGASLLSASRSNPLFYPSYPNPNPPWLNLT